MLIRSETLSPSLGKSPDSSKMIVDGARLILLALQVECWDNWCCMHHYVCHWFCSLLGSGVTSADKGCTLHHGFCVYMWLQVTRYALCTTWFVFGCDCRGGNLHCVCVIADEECDRAPCVCVCVCMFVWFQVTSACKKWTLHHVCVWLQVKSAEEG